MDAEKIREARLTAVAMIRASYEERPMDVGRLLAGYEGDTADILLAAVSFASAMLLPAAVTVERSPRRLLDDLTQVFIGPDGGKPGNEF